MTLKYYILDPNGIVRTTTSLDEQVEWYQKVENRRVAKTDLGPKGTVYTTFIGIIASEFNPPIWETMVFRSSKGIMQWRWNTLEEAKAGHEMVVKMLEGEII